MKRIITILAANFRQRTLLEFVMLILKNIYQADPILVYAYNLKHFRHMPLPGLEGYEISKGTPLDLAAARERLTPIPWEFQCDLFDNVTDFFVAKDSSGIQCICWIYYPEDHNRILKLMQCEAEIKFCLTLPDARGKGLYPMVINAILDYLGSKGFSKAYMCVHKDNKSSIRGIEKAGFARIGSVTLRRIAGFQISKRLVTLED